MRQFGKHVRRNSVAYLALFFALGGTSIAAVNSLPKNSVGSAQIKNGSIQKVDISRRTVSALHGLRGPRGIQGAQGIQGIQGIQGVKGDKGDKGDPATRLWAVVHTNGTTASLVRSSGATAATQTNPGFINVTFNQNVDTCAYIVTTGLDNFSLPPRGGATADRNPSEPNKVYVQTFDTSGADAVRDYFLAVFC
jgi:hypothetical protein